MKISDFKKWLIDNKIPDDAEMAAPDSNGDMICLWGVSYISKDEDECAEEWKNSVSFNFN